MGFGKHSFKMFNRKEGIIIDVGPDRENLAYYLTDDGGETWTQKFSKLTSEEFESHSADIIRIRHPSKDSIEIDINYSYSKKRKYFKKYKRRVIHNNIATLKSFDNGKSFTLKE